MLISKKPARTCIYKSLTLMARVAELAGLNLPSLPKSFVAVRSSRCRTTDGRSRSASEIKASAVCKDLRVNHLQSNPWETCLYVQRNFSLLSETTSACNGYPCLCRSRRARERLNSGASHLRKTLCYGVPCWREYEQGLTMRILL